MTTRLQARMGDLAGEEVEEAFQLVRVAPKRRRQLDRVGALGRLDCAHVELELVAVALHAAQDAHGVAFGEPAVEEIDVVPDAALDSATAVDELQRQVVGRRSRVRRRRLRATAYVPSTVASSASSAIAATAPSLGIEAAGRVNAPWRR